jgi:hypothetical protein
MEQQLFPGVRLQPIETRGLDVPITSADNVGVDPVGSVGSVDSADPAGSSGAQGLAPPFDPSRSLFGSSATLPAALAPYPASLAIPQSNPFGLTLERTFTAATASVSSDLWGAPVIAGIPEIADPAGSSFLQPIAASQISLLPIGASSILVDSDSPRSSAPLDPLEAAERWFTSELPPILPDAERFQPALPETLGAVASATGDPLTQSNLDASTGGLGNALSAPVSAASSVPAWSPAVAGSSPILKAPLPLPAKDRVRELTASILSRLLSTPRKTRMVVGAAVVALVGGLGVGASVLSPRGPGWAHQWDPTILPLAEQTAALRGLKFLHPVRVEFLESNAFDAAALARELKRKSSAQSGGRCWTSVDGGPKYPMCNFSTPFVTEVQPLQSAYRALGVPINAPAPSTNSFGEIGDSLVLARYLPSEHLIEVRGAYSAGLAPTLVHELAHALQDQHFGLSFSGKNDDESLAYRALVEGDAMLTEYRYRFSLPEAEAAVIEETDTQTSKEAKARLSAVVGQTTGQKIERPSAALQVEIDVAEFPYVQGTEFAVSQWKARSPKDYNALFRSPPKTTGSILYPGRDPHIGGETVKASPKIPGRTRYSKGDVVFGPLLFLVAMERNGGAAEGQVVASAWRGERTQIYQDRGSRRVCFSSDIAFGGDSATLARGGLAGWASARGLVTKFEGEFVHLEGCDPFGTV